MAEMYIGFRPVWQQIQDKLHPVIVQKLEYLIGSEIIEDSVLHFAEAQNLAEILVQKVTNINLVLVDAEETEKMLFNNVNPTFFQSYTSDILNHPTLQTYIQKATQVHKFLQTQSIQKFKDNQSKSQNNDGNQQQSVNKGMYNQILAAPPSELKLSDEFVEKIRHILRLEHKELDQRIQYLQNNIYNNHKLERIARSVYKQFQDANASVDVAQLKKFQEYLHSKQFNDNAQKQKNQHPGIAKKQPDRDLNLGDLEASQAAIRELGTTDSEFDERLCQSVRAHRPRTKRFELDQRPETGASLRQSIKLPPKPLHSLVQSKLD